MGGWITVGDLDLLTSQNSEDVGQVTTTILSQRHGLRRSLETVLFQSLLHPDKGIFQGAIVVDDHFLGIDGTVVLGFTVRFCAHTNSGHLRSFALEIHFSGNRSRLGEIGSNSLRCLLRRRSLVGGLLGSGGSSTAGEGNRDQK